MSWHGFSTPIQLDNAVSPRLLGAVCVLHALGAVALLNLSLPLTARLAMLLALGGCAYDVLRKILLRAGRRCILRMELAAGGAWRLTDGAGDVFGARLLRDSRISLPLLALRWRDGRGRRHRAFLAADAIEPQTLRRLRVHLRFGADDLLECGERNRITKS
ncbi:MAG: hypothetical protein H0W33_10565 [Gammaproteobacteria bacterium]|nr:hypothetical protein [Gammaproteobacteria bacterium]